LLSASPDMPLHHPPDFEGFRRHGNRRLDRSITCSADAQLMPYITREDLLHDHHLLLFINSRGRNQPGLFPSTDSVKAHLGQGWKSWEGTCTRYKRDGYDVMLLYSSETLLWYGTVVSRSKFPTEFVATHGYSPIHGLLILEIQKKIHSFLLHCVRSVLHDFNPDTLMLLSEEVESLPLESVPRSTSESSVERLTTGSRLSKAAGSRRPR
jgi:hypothetical protein